MMSTELGISPFDPSSVQQENDGSVNWIGAYMEWMGMEWTDRSGSPCEAGADNSELFVAAYLEWMDAELRAHEPRPGHHATASADYRRIKDDGIGERIQSWAPPCWPPDTPSRKSCPVR